MTTPQQHELAQRMSELAMHLQDENDRDTTLHAIVGAAIDMIPGAAWAGISLIQGKTIIPEVPSHARVAELDQLQSELREGPAISAIREHNTVFINDLAEPDTRWPHFATKAVELGVRSMLCLRLFVRRENLGALNLYAAEPDVFTTDDAILADLVAQHAAVALADATHEHHLSLALLSRDVIGQAKGILMHRDQLTNQQAFDLLVRTASDVNMKLIDVARWLVTETESRTSRDH